MRIGVLTIAVMAVATSPALGADRTVAKATDTACGKGTTFHTIQSAVNASAPGDTVHVCPGLYQEQVVIGPGQDKVKLQSVKERQAAIRFPSGMLATPKAVVDVNTAKNVEIDGFTIEGPWTDGSGCAASLAQHYGIRVEGGGSAKIDDNHITLIEDSMAALRGCQDGVAIQVGRMSEATTGSAEIVDNVIDKYQKNGPTIDNTGSSGNIHDNTIDGGGDNDQSAKNGIQISRGATAKVEHNEVFNNYYTGNGPPPPSDSPDDSDGDGILLFTITGGVTVNDNDTYLNDLGIDLTTVTGSVISNNMTTGNTFDGLRAESDTSGNTFMGNKSSSNDTHDCHDDSTGSGTAMTANTWKSNQGVTQNKPGLCTPPK